MKVGIVGGIGPESTVSLILGCTEFPLILHNGDCSIPFLNTVEIHVQCIIRELLN